ncbi:MAG: hypothetical protein GY906_15830 [bacterium]|nr:hypothetical protein [bacterium]
MRRTIALFMLCVFAGALVASAATGYIVILKNGHKIRAKEPLRIEGRTAIITLSNGTMTSYPLDYVDLVATQKYNQSDVGDAIEIKELERINQPRATPTPHKSLGSYATISPLTDAELGATNTPTPVPTPGIKLQSGGYSEPRITRAFGEFLDTNKLYLHKSSAGTKAEYFFLQIIADDENQVFQTLKVVAEAYSLIHQRFPDIAPDSVELEMVSTGHNAAGTFRITPDMATQLTGGKISPEEFYVKHVIF